MLRTIAYFGFAFSSLLVACSPAQHDTAAARQFPETALTVTPSDSNALLIELRTSPEQPPTRGVLDIALDVRAASDGTPISGLDLTVTPWMPAMGHGISTTPSVTELSPGQYLVPRVGLFMPGTWQLRTEIAGSIRDHVDASFEIE